MIPAGAMSLTATSVYRSSAFIGDAGGRVVFFSIRSGSWRAMPYRCHLWRAGFVVLITAIAANGQTPATRTTSQIPRMPGGKPNFTGLWQALGTADWDIQDHSAHAGPFFQLGATGAEPAGQGIVEGGEIPYTPAAAAKQKENLKNRMKLDPEIKCDMPGIPRAKYMPFPFQINWTCRRILRSPTSMRRRTAWSTWASSKKVWWTRGWGHRTATGKATRWWWMLSGFER